MAMARAEARQHGPLRPRKVSAPSYRPPHRAGGAVTARQGVPGAGEGQPTATTRAARRRPRSRRGCPRNRSGLRGYGLWAPGRFLTPRAPACRALAPGSPRVRPVRRCAHPLRARRREHLVPSARRGPGAQVLHGARQRRGQAGPGGALAVCGLQWPQGLVASGLVPPQHDGGCREGPRERGVADLRARGAVPLPGRRLRALDEPARREDLWAPRAPAEVVAGREEHATQARAEPGHGWPPGAGSRGGLVGQGPAGHLHGVPPRVVVVNQGEVPRQAARRERATARRPRHGWPERHASSPSQAGCPASWSGGCAPAVPPAGA